MYDMSLLMTEKKKIFISYARENLKDAKKLFGDLKQHGFDPWLDEENLLAGQDWRQSIRKAIKNSDYVVILLSSISISKRGFVQVEQKRALETAEEFPDFESFIIPVRINECEIPFSLENLQCADLFPDYEKGLNKIIRALQVERKSDTKPKPPVLPPPPQAKPNIYVSFSVIDNDHQWILTFVHHLESEIGKRLGTKDAFSIFMDRDAQTEASQIPSEIIQKIENSDILIAVLSPGYSKSDRCKRERFTFLRKSKEFIIVEREKVDENDLPDEFKARKFFRFWIERDGKSPKILGHPKVNLDKDDEYFEIVKDMSYALADRIKFVGANPCVRPVRPFDRPFDHPSFRLQEGQPQGAAPTDECVKITDVSIGSTTGFPPVFLAEVTDDLLQIRDEIERYLIQAGFRVVPENPIDMTETAIMKELEPCRVFVQALSEFGGKSRKAQIGKCRLQSECAKKAGKMILQWRSSDLKIDKADEDQKNLLNEPGVVAIGLEQFKEMIAKRAAFKLSQTPLAPDVMVFINADPIDKTHAEDVGRLMENRSIGHVLPIWEGDETELLQDMENFILNAHGIVIVYGNARVAWVRKQILYCRNLIYRRTEPLKKALGVYDAPAPNKQDLGIKLPGVVIINCRNCVSEAEFAPFFNALTKGGVTA
jgi:hypothetical protein